MTGKVHAWTFDRNFTQMILKDKFDIWTKQKYHPARILFKTGIISARHGPHVADKGNAWIYQRKTAVKLFTKSSFHGAITDVIKKKCSDMLAKMESHCTRKPKQTFRLKPEIYHFAFCIIGSVGFGMNFEELKERENYQKCFDGILRLTIARSLTPGYYLPFGLGNHIPGLQKEFTDTLNTMDNFCKKIARSKFKQSSAGLKEEHNLLSFFLENPSMIPKDTKLSDIIFNFMFAGRDTSSIVMSFVVYFLATNLKAQDKLYQEICEVIGGADVSPECFSKMKYLDSVVLEAMRINPPVQYYGKHLQVDDFYNASTPLKKDLFVLFDIFTMGRNPRVYEKPEEFNPDRWMNDDRKVGSFDEYEFPVFQGGPRMCLGKDLAFLEIKFFAVYLFRKYRVRIDPAEMKAYKEDDPLYAPTLVGAYRSNLDVLLEPRVY
eukprot:augustus_masked-scaffold_2-processed-gene-13.51-mRNA-1 protein AED:0.42 eAED:0.42 QI:0/-1/0/1/-1/1/1/0/433